MTAPLVIACGALASELRAVLRAQALADAVEVTYLPANLHNRPERIVPELEPLLDQAAAQGRSVFIGYADCGTGGALDALLERHPEATRLPGDHCYEFFSGSDVFAAMHEEELGTFFLTDFLAKHFDALLWQGLGSRPAPATARDVLRQLQASRVDLAERGSSRSSTEDVPRQNGSVWSSNTVTSVCNRSPPRSRTPSRSRCRRGSPDAAHRPIEPRAHRDLLARHPRAGQRPRRARPPSGRARRQVPAGHRSGQAQGQDLHGRRRGCPVATREPGDHRRPGAQRRRPLPMRSSASTGPNAWACSPTTEAGKPTW